MAKPRESRKRSQRRAGNKTARLAAAETYVRLDAFDGTFLPEDGLLAGADEAGRGALAGPVVAAAVVLPRDSGLIGVNDSKQLEEDDRERLFSEIVAKALSVGIGFSQPATIDRENILNATLMAMATAVRNLRVKPAIILLDGRDRIESAGTVISVIGGDGKSLSIAAASVVAKVARDRVMRKLHKLYPNYNFLHNKGYGTKQHLEAILEHGTLPIHRRTYLKAVEKRPTLF